MRFARRTLGDHRPIDLIPVVNVVLLLTFFFLLSWSFVLQPGVEVRLPSASFTGMSQQGRHVITLKNDPQGERMMFFDEKVVSALELRALLIQASKKNYADWLTVNADESVSHGHVQQIVGWAMEQGFKVTIATQRMTKTEAEGKAP